MYIFWLRIKSNFITNYHAFGIQKIGGEKIVNSSGRDSEKQHNS